MAGACAAPPASAPAPAGVVYLVALGEVDAAEIDRAAWALAEATDRPVKQLGRRSLPAHLQQRTLDAGALLDLLLRVAPPDTFRIAGVVDGPLHAPGHGGLIGYARHGERSLVYSTASLPRYETEASRRRRVRRIIAHELGHTFGAEHCARSCVMRDTHTPQDIDLLPDHYCDEHRAAVERGLAEGPEDPAALTRLGAEQLRLGRWGHAADAYRAALRQRPRDARLRTSLGIALLAHGELTAAEEHFVTASRLEPEAPQPYYARAVLYAVGGEPRRAPAYLEAAVSRDGDRLRAHRAAGILYQDVLEDDAQAVRHFETHLRLGGRDHRVIGRLSYLLAPTTITFDEPETIIARWNPERGLQLAWLKR